jgi:hypothetical protein
MSTQSFINVLDARPARGTKGAEDAEELFFFLSAERAEE